MKVLILTVFTLLAIPFSAGIAQVRAEDAAPFDASTASAPSTAAPEFLIQKLGLTPDDTLPLRQTANNRIVNTIDGITLRLQSGESIELPGLWVPPGRGYEPSDEMLNAKALLDKILLDNDGDRNVTLYQTAQSGSGRVNRLGREMAHVVRKNNNVWLQGSLLANGLVQAWPTPQNPELATRMYAIEDSARRAGLGMWSGASPYRLLNAEDDITALDRFAVVEGTVKSISMVNNVTYLNFGADWKTDFTIGVSSPVRQILLRNNVDLQKMQGQRVRVRGWLRSYNGPFIELEDSIALETLDIAKQDNIVPGAPQLSRQPRMQHTKPVIVNGMKEIGTNAP